MANYQWADAVTLAKPFVKSIPSSSFDLAFCDSLNGTIWRYWFWKWSITSLTAIPAVDGTQDYTVSNSDFYRLYRVRLTRTDLTPDVSREKNIVAFLSPNLEQTGTIDTIQAVCYIDALSKIRLDKAASVGTGVTWQIDGDYQKKNTKLTSTATDVPFPDLYFDVAVEGLKWKYYQLADDPRAGTQTTTGTGQMAYTGQLGVFTGLLEQMAQAEGKGYGDAQRFPAEALGVGRASNPGMFGYS